MAKLKIKPLGDRVLVEHLGEHGAFLAGLVVGRVIGALGEALRDQLDPKSRHAG